MNQFIGTKIINAKPMYLGDYNSFRGWELPEEEYYYDKGYLVEYTNDDGKPNTKEYAGYVSWSPSNVFESSYKKSGELSFGNAIDYMELGYKVSRAGWNGKGMYLQLFSPVAHGMEELTILDNEPNGTTKPLLPFIMMKTADDMFVPWLASQTDMLAKDWGIYNV